MFQLPYDPSYHANFPATFHIRKTTNRVLLPLSSQYMDPSFVLHFPLMKDGKYIYTFERHRRKIYHYDPHPDIYHVSQAMNEARKFA